ncbi:MULTISPECIES: hypothetical protein [Corallococcus]|uniref:hypothetical protein n=1 Tax=Corallococcus TaxID=83461 RepID=UPI0018F316A9|nr:MULTISPECIES: hypothetical protein [Corallococcus]
MPESTTDDLARTEASPRRRQLPPTPARPLHLFTIDGIRYEAVRELVLMETGELLMLAQRFSERVPTLPGFCFVRRLANPSTYIQRTRLGEEIQLAFRLRHPAIAQVFHRKVHQGALHVVMESVDGPSLETLVSAGVARGRPVSEAFALAVAERPPAPSSPRPSPSSERGCRCRRGAASHSGRDGGACEARGPPRLGGARRGARPVGGGVGTQGVARLGACRHSSGSSDLRRVASS